MPVTAPPTIVAVPVAVLPSGDAEKVTVGGRVSGAGVGDRDTGNCTRVFRYLTNDPEEPERGCPGRAIERRPVAVDREDFRRVVGRIKDVVRRLQHGERRAPIVVVGGVIELVSPPGVEIEGFRGVGIRIRAVEVGGQFGDRPCQIRGRVDRFVEHGWDHTVFEQQRTAQPDGEFGASSHGTCRE